MIYKVFYQESKDQVPVRENTKALYIEASTEREVRQKLKDRNINIEYITALDEAMLNYEKNTENFKLESL
ncbi:DNA-dependent RNA polymerase auxiliary subunit epsilon [Pullulanibacillus pueri]|uniref:DNA-directed RNA polymerase subunit epsilon n=1 Tax=Pullulanibacillus pueri TaxID=1437324 RepID=A0A8J3EJ85_9BACL|nr:DNA-directed RNA polymerase subunit epsilon [Pullulanibacillus pueri]MBM7680070.1 DNA-dependent RNA polymerase auxiliary subunit epsilon [Pullulanibacillus pueri]GGH74224.1 UPF0356 protein YkzG [Pullulanibacillus pueri]